MFCNKLSLKFLSLNFMSGSNSFQSQSITNTVRLADCVSISNDIESKYHSQIINRYCQKIYIATRHDQATEKQLADASSRSPFSY